MRTLSLILLGSILSAVPVQAQSWSGILNPSRAVDWTFAGVSGGIPTRTTVCSTLSPGATAAQINTAISSCPNGQVVKLNAGTYQLTSGINFNGRSNVTLRGAGANQTFLVFTGDYNCRGFGSSICMASSNNPVMPNPSTTGTWTAGYMKGTTGITLNSTTGMNVGDLLIVDQLDDSSDGGGVFVCSTSNTCSTEGGNSYGRSGRAQQQIVEITGKNGTTLTISPPLHMPNWRSSQSPGWSFASGSPSGSGIEDLSIDSSSSGGTHSVVMLYVHDCWVKGVQSINTNRSHVYIYQSLRITVSNSYLFGTQNHASQSYGIELFSSGNALIENNIMQHIAGPLTINGSDSGSVFAYNYSFDNYYTPSTNWMIPSMIAHESGIGMNLFEGNDGLGFEGDIIHGTHHFLTAFRNHFTGDPQKTNNTAIIHLWAFSRYFNIVGNVLGRTGYYTTYEGDSPTSIFGLGGGGPRSDSLVKTTLMRWGNYDTVNGMSRFLSSEVPTGLSAYANSLPSGNALPPSFYLSAKPGWFGNTAWPPIGPDVTGGQNTGGHAYNIPAKACYNNTAKDGSGRLTSFSAATCYGSVNGGTSNPPSPPAAPQNLQVS